MKDGDNVTSRQLGLLLLIVSLIPASAEGIDNLLINPGFEEGTVGWAGRGCDLSTSTVSRSGDYSGYATNRDFRWQGIKQSVFGRMIPGETYTISAWIRLENASSDQIIATVEQRDDRGVRYTRVAETTGSDNRWTHLSGWFTLNVVGILTALDVYFEGPAPGVNFYLDDVEVLGRAADLPEPPKPNATGSVDVGTVYQELEGFGASGAWYEGWLTHHPLKSEIYDILFGQLGLDIFRLRNLYQLNDDWSSGVAACAEIIRAAEVSLGHPMKIMVSSWSPPAYLKSNGSVAGGTLARSPGGRYQYDEFAQWWAVSLTVYGRHGIDPDYISIQNEPEFLADYDSCKFTPTETSEWAGYDLAFEAVHQELASRMTDMPPRLLAPDSFGCSASRAYIDALIDPGQAYGYAHHLYADGAYDNPDSFIPAMQSYAAKYDDKPLFQTEYSCLCDVQPFGVALNLARHIHNSLVHEGVCAYFHWSLFWADGGGLVTLDNPWQGSPGYAINHTYYAFKQYSAFTDPGWRRVAASTDSTGLRISAFKNSDSTELSIVIINVSDIRINFSLSLGGFSPDSSGVYRTSETEHTEYSGTFDESQALPLPSQSITTVHLTGSYSPSIPSVEGFETGNFSGLPWNHAGEGSWTVTQEHKYRGAYSAQSGAIGHGERTTLQVTLECVSGDVTFFRKVSSERGYDGLAFSIDGVEKDEWSGEEDWTEVSFPVTAGTRTFAWTYAKDSTMSVGEDTAWVDDIEFPIP